MPPPPQKKKCLSSEGVLQFPFPPPFFGAYVSRRKMLENQSSHFLKKSENNDVFGKQFNYSPFLKEITFNNPLTF